MFVIVVNVVVLVKVLVGVVATCGGGGANTMNLIG